MSRRLDPPPAKVVRLSSRQKPPPENAAEQLLSAWLAKQNAKPGPMFGAVLAEQDDYAVGANGIPYVYRGGVYVRAARIVKQRIQAIAGEAWSRHIQNEVEAWLAAHSPPLD